MITALHSYHGLVAPGRPVPLEITRPRIWTPGQRGMNERSAS
jgi:hypothetical protein